MQKGLSTQQRRNIKRKFVLRFFAAVLYGPMLVLAQPSNSEFYYYAGDDSSEKIELKPTVEITLMRQASGSDTNNLRRAAKVQEGSPLSQRNLALVPRRNLDRQVVPKRFACEAGKLFDFGSHKIALVNEFFIKLERNVPSVETFLSKNGLQVIAGYSSIEDVLLVEAPGINPCQALGKINKMVEVKKIEFGQPNFISIFQRKASSATLKSESDLDALKDGNEKICTYDEDYEKGWHKTNIGLVDGIENEAGPRVKVAVLDSGIYAQHDELVGRVESLTICDSEGNESLKRVFCSKAGEHGTAVAGLIVGRSRGITSNVSIIDVPIKWVGQRDGKLEEQLEYKQFESGVELAILQGARVFNMSGFIAPRHEAIERAIQRMLDVGILVISAGNDGETEVRTSNFPPPVSENLPIVVGASKSGGQMVLDADDQGWASNHGPKVDIYAPGICLTTSVKVVNRESKLSYLSGTSYASPLISGAAAILFGRSPSVAAANIRKKILKGADIVCSRNNEKSWKRVKVLNIGKSASSI